MSGTDSLLAPRRTVLRGDRVLLNGHTLRELVWDECTSRQMARLLGCHRSTVFKRLKRLGLRLRRARRPDQTQRARVMDLVAAGVNTCAGVARCLGVTPPRAWRLVRELEVGGLLKMDRPGTNRRDWRIKLNINWDLVGPGAPEDPDD
jgi:hypothetical protein